MSNMRLQSYVTFGERNVNQQPPINNPGTPSAGDQWNGQAWMPPPAPAKPTKPWWKKWWVWVLIVVGLSVLGSLLGGGEKEATPASSPVSTTKTPETTPEPETTAPESTTETPEPETPVSEYGDYPKAQVAFIDGVEAARTAYNAAETDLQRAKVIKDRNRKLLKRGGGSNVSGWVGMIDKVGANGEGKAYVTIKISDNIKIQTWNNALSDIPDGTLIPESSPVYDALLDMVPGDKVVFSGSFVAKDGAALYPTNVTETFGALTPEFLFKFSKVAPA